VSQHALFSCTITNAPSIAAQEKGSDKGPSELVVSHISMIGHQQNGPPRPTTLRKTMKNTELGLPAAVTGPLVKANEVNEPQLRDEDDEKTVSFPPPSQPTYSPHSKCTCCLLCVVWADVEAQRTPSIVCVCMHGSKR